MADNINMSLKNTMGGCDWIYVVQDMDNWRAFVATVMNLRVRQNAENFLVD
jgi:hypothetical protein